MSGSDIGNILGYGITGLGFLLAFLTYRLLARAQSLKLEKPHTARIYVFMVFSFLLCVLGLISQFIPSQSRYKSESNPTPTPQLASSPVPSAPQNVAQPNISTLNNIHADGAKTGKMDNRFSFTVPTCHRSGRTVTCDLTVKNIGDDRIFSIVANGTRLIDNKENDVSITTAMLANHEGWNEGGGMFSYELKHELVAEGEASVRLIFQPVPLNSDRISKFVLTYRWVDISLRNNYPWQGTRFEVEYRDLPIMMAEQSKLETAAGVLVLKPVEMRKF